MEEFILNYLLPSYPSAVTKEDENENLPFVEVTVAWVRLRVEAWDCAIKGQGATMGLANIVSLAAKAFFSQSINKLLRNCNTKQDTASMTMRKIDATAKPREPKARARTCTPMVEWSLGMLNAILASKRRTIPLPSREPDGHPFNGESMASLGESSPDLFLDGRIRAREGGGERLFLINKQGTIEMVNVAAEAEFGWTKQEFSKNNISMICDRDHSPRHNQYLEAYVKIGMKKVMGKHDRKLLVKQKDGSEFQNFLSALPKLGSGMKGDSVGRVRLLRADHL